MMVSADLPRFRLYKPQILTIFKSFLSKRDNEVSVMVTLDNATQNKIQVIQVSEALDLLRLDRTYRSSRCT